MSVKMQHSSSRSSSSSSSSSSVTEVQQLWEGWTTKLNGFYDDPKVVQLMSTRIGQYLSSHPLLALSVMLFGAIAAVPVGLFLCFALVTFIMSAVGFVFFEGFLLCVGGLTLLCVLSGIAFFSVMVSFIYSVLYITILNILKRYQPHLTEQGRVQEKEEEESQCKSSTQKEMQ